METRTEKIAQEIIGQIGIVGPMIGARNFVPIEADDEHRGGVQFHVGRGNWYVEVIWNFLDLYDVRFRTRKTDRIGFFAEDIYCDKLPTTLLDGAGKCGPSGV